MSQLNDLLDFIKTRMPEGVTFGEVQSYLEIEDKVEVRNLLTEALDKNIITKIGERRATHYVARADAVIAAIDEDDDSIIGNKALETYLLDTTPVHEAVIVHIENIVKFKTPKTLLQFIQNGRRIITYIINYDRDKKKNVVTEKTEIVRMNYFSIRGKEFIIEKFDQIANKKEIIPGGSYEELREELTINLK